MSKKDNSFGFVMGILAGVVGGIAAGVLLAPKSGKQVRKELCNTIEDLREKYSPEIQVAKRQAMNIILNAKDNLSAAYQKFNDHLRAKQLAKAKNFETDVYEI